MRPCRYLQQLVSAQASRNRDLEKQLQGMRIGGESSSPSSADVNDEEMLVLNSEEDFNLNINGHTNGSSTSRTKKFGGFELESVAEMDQDTDDYYPNGYRRRDSRHEEDQDMDRPSTAGTGVGASPLSQCSGSDEQDNDRDNEESKREEEERGRKGRDGRPMGSAGMNGVAMKTEEGMESS